MVGFIFNKQEKRSNEMANKETTVKAADAKAAEARQGDLEKLIVAEAMKVTEGKQHSVQQMMAYCRKLQKQSK